MKIVCVGCSWTCGVVAANPLEQDTYPHIIKEHYPEAEVFNLGLSGGSNFLISMILDWALLNIKPDIVVRQYSSCHRWQMSKVDKLRYVRYNEVAPNYHKLDIKSISEQFVSWTANKVSYPNHHKYEYSEKELDQMYRDFNERTSFETSQHLEEALFFRTQAQLQGVPNVQFFWRQNYHRSVMAKHFLHIPAVISQPWHDECTVDKGGHFGRKGNELLFEHIINPELEKCIHTVKSRKSI